jgi:uncharacterized protein
VIDGDLFVIDSAIHVHDLSDENVRHDVDDAVMVRDQMRAGAEYWRPDIFSGPVDLRGRCTIEGAYQTVFVESATDMAMAVVVPLFDWYEDFFAPVEAQAAMARAYPERVLFCAGVDPLYRGLDYALEQLEYQVVELGAVSVKFYNGHTERSWRCDDETLAYPLYERARELGINVLQFHKGFPFGRSDIDAMRPVDLQKPARDFDDLAFLVHHLAVPYEDEMISIASRFPNVHIALTPLFNLSLVAPRRVQEWVGKCLQMVGVEKLVWGTDAPLSGSPAPYLEAFLELEIPDDLRSGYGYPQITREDKAKILGLNFAQLMGIDIEAKKRSLGAPTAAA